MLEAGDTERYLRHILLKEVGAQGQQKLLAARVVIVGAGGLGAPIVQYLAAAGVGRMVIADGDRVDISNLQRQVIYKTEDVGELKAEVAAHAARAINPRIQIDAVPHDQTEEDLVKLATNADLVIEGVDRFTVRYELNRACIKTRTPLLSAAIGRYDGQIAMFDPTSGAFPCYRCLVPEPPPAESTSSCEEEGVLGPVAGVVGSMAALEAVKWIVGLGPEPRGSLLLYDAINQTSRRISLPRDPLCLDCGDL